MGTLPNSMQSRWSHPAIILVATDLSDLSRLMPFAFDQATQSGARLVLLHVVAPGTPISLDASGMPYYDPAGEMEFAAKLLEPWREAAHSRHIGCDTLLREGDVAQQIGVVLRQFQADRLLMGTRNSSKRNRFALGSVADKVLRSVNLPVMTVGPEAQPATDPGSEPSQPVVLYSTSLRERARASASLACQAAVRQGARMLLMHVLPPMDERAGLAGLEAMAHEELRQLAQAMEVDCGLTLETMLAHGNPAIEILAAAAERRASLIVLGATQRSAFENLARDRTIYRVLAHARCPVLTLREPAPSESEPTMEWLAFQG